MTRNAGSPWRIASQYLHNNNNKNSVIYSVKELQVFYIGGHNLAESRNKGRYTLTCYEGEKNLDKGTSSACKTPSAAPMLPSSV